MKINEVEALVGITKKNIRFYEGKGLLSPLRNGENGYRDYGREEVAILQRIKLLRKLGVPIEEIRRMQTGAQTVGDGMKRHLITLERERQNLEQAIRFCTLLQEKDIPLSELDAGQVLEEMDRLEQAGTTFQNKQVRDIRIRYVAPVLITAATVLLMTCLLVLFAHTYYMDQGKVIPFAIVWIIFLAPVLVSGGVVSALYQRIREIMKGEADDAKQY